MSWLVVGGAGYIGSHVVRRLRADGRDVVVLDDLSTGVRERIPAGVPLVVSGLDRATIAATLRRYAVTGVVNLAARKSAPESVAQPLWYYEQNVEGMRALLEAAVDVDVRQVVLSSSAAVYGRPPGARVTEETPTEPINPYGETKLMCEWMLRAAGVAHGVSWIALRYFNIVGSTDPVCADTSGDSLFPRVFQRLATGRPAVVTGRDFPTRDGTGVRDYVHVADVADAHAAAIARLESGRCADVYNVGTGSGYSVLEVLAAVREVTGLPVEVEVVPPRPGDPPEVVAAVDKIGREMSWQARNDLYDMVRSTWQAWRPMVGAPTRPARRRRSPAPGRRQRVR
ncbi:UDP-glucose 4-epimerase GalE [Micromonospora fluostatini]|uniref:UDP-glucose 4-epimerase GalE n=1 Tax=Micromonospora sp. JCM 30529 TaxID=3421643 RepID=UPI003D162882